MDVKTDTISSAIVRAVDRSALSFEVGLYEISNIILDMQPIHCILGHMGDVFKALADDCRRSLLDRLFERNGLTLNDLCADMTISRQAVSKHLGILEEANLVSVHWRGREKLHYLNPVPLAEVVHRWVGRFEDARLEMLLDFKHETEARRRKRRAKSI